MSWNGQNPIPVLETAQITAWFPVLSVTYSFNPSLSFLVFVSSRCPSLVPVTCFGKLAIIQFPLFIPSTSAEAER